MGWPAEFHMPRELIGIGDAMTGSELDAEARTRGAQRSSEGNSVIGSEEGEVVGRTGASVQLRKDNGEAGIMVELER